MLVSLLLLQSIVHMQLSHYEEAIKCCDAALIISSESPEIFYRKSQAILYNSASTVQDLKLALENAEAAIKIRSSETRYQDHLKAVRNRIDEKKEMEKKIVDSVVSTAIKTTIVPAATSITDSMKILEK